MGRGPKGAFPVIAGQPRAYLAATLKAYQMGTRQSGYMQSAAARYDDEVLERLATYYAEKSPTGGAAVTAGSTPRQPASSGSTPAEPSRSAADATSLAEAGSKANAEPRPLIDVYAIDPAAATGVPVDRKDQLALGRRIAEAGLPERKIAACQSCHGPEGMARNPYFPKLDGQPFWYLKTHLELWKEGHRGGTKFAHLMDPIAINLTPEQIDAVSLWYESRD